MAETYALKVSEEVNRNSPPRNMILLLSTPYTDPERQNTDRRTYRQTVTDRHADDILKTIADHTA